MFKGCSMFIVQRCVIWKMINDSLLLMFKGCSMFIVQRFVIWNIFDDVLIRNMIITQTLPQSWGTEGEETTKSRTRCWPQRCRPRCWNQILYTPWSFLKVVGRRQLRVEQWLDQLALEESGLEGVGSAHQGVGGVNEALEERASRQEKGKKRERKK